MKKRTEVYEGKNTIGDNGDKEREREKHPGKSGLDERTQSGATYERHFAKDKSRLRQKFEKLKSEFVKEKIAERPSLIKNPIPKKPKVTLHTRDILPRIKAG